MFKGVSQCISNVGILYFAPFNPSHFFPLPLCLLSPPHTLLTTFSVFTFIFYLPNVISSFSSFYM
jgi:hypothetical protein